MKKIVLTIFASLLSGLGLIYTFGALASTKTPEQLEKLFSFDYMSFVDSTHGGASGQMSNDFFTGLGLLLVGNISLTRVEQARPYAAKLAALCFFIIGMALIYGCINPRIGIKPF